MAHRRAPAREKRGYHHGALREALLEVAEELLEARGVEGFTLRECARRAGVSHGAPAHHFGDATGLLSELTATSFESLLGLMIQYRRESGRDPFGQFVATGLAYVDYALAHRARFQLMFRGARLDFGNERLALAAGRTYEQLEETLKALTPPRGRKALSLDERASLAWSIVHGVATLALENEKLAATPKDASGVHDAVRRMLEASRPVFAGPGRARRDSPKA